MEDLRLTVIGHLEELRFRIIKSLIAIAVAAAVAYQYADAILVLMSLPVGKLVFISPEEAFLVKVKIAFFAGSVIASPFVVYQIWHFVGAGLKKAERHLVLVFGAFSLFLFFVGCCIGAGLVVPAALRFLMSFSSQSLVPMITAGRYVSFVGVLTLVFGIVFQLPLVLIFLTRLGIIDVRTVARRRKEVIFVIFVVAAILTPPDVISQIAMALPLIVLFEVGIVCSRLAVKRL